jgi:CheY-like chemotaxis protein
MREVCQSNQASAAKAKGAKDSLKPVDVILMDLWMPEMDGYQATEHILKMFEKGEDARPNQPSFPVPTVLAVSADVTDEAISKATTTGMEGFMTKPYKLTDLQSLIEEYCVRNARA